VDLAGADKKIVAILAAGWAFTPAFLLLAVYAGWLAALVRRRARAGGAVVRPVAALSVGGLLAAKSAAMTAGRWWGSVKYGACCF
jgi:hypothetical protein